MQCAASSRGNLYCPGEILCYIVNRIKNDDQILFTANYIEDNKFS